MAASCVDRKGPTACAVQFLVGVLRDIGHRRIELKCDNESSTVSLRSAVIDACRDIEVLPKGPPVGDHQANGLVEVAVRTIKRQCRVIRLSTENELCMRIPDDHPCLTWLPRFASNLIVKYKLGSDGMTAYQRSCGKRWKRPAVQFMEKVHFKKIGELGPSTYASRMGEGHFIGYHDRTASVLVMTKDGIQKGKSLLRQTEVDAWNTDGFNQLFGTPWQMVAKVLRTPKAVTANEDSAGPAREPRTHVRAPEVAPRK